MEKNFVFSERLFLAIEQSNKSTNCIERELGYPRNALHGYKNGAEPSACRLVELAHYFHLTPEYLLGKTNEISSINSEIIFDYLDDEQKLKMLMLALEWEKHKMIELIPKNRRHQKSNYLKKL